MKSTIHKSVYFLNIIAVFWSAELLSKEIQLKCDILQENENNSPSKKNLYSGNSLQIFLNTKDKWINDLSKEDWLNKMNEDVLNVSTVFKVDNNNIFFTYKNFLTPEKKKTESSFSIKLSKKNGHLKFIKYYYNFEQEIFFTSELVGVCDIKKLNLLELES